MHYHLEDKTVIVTGSSRGIGRATAQHLLSLGAKVVINGRNTEQLEATAAALDHKNLLAVPGDVTKEADVNFLIDRTLATFQRVDVLINNAAISMRGSFRDLRPEVAEKVISINTLGAIMPTILCLPHIQKTSGSIVFLSSISGICGFPGASVYSASKMAITAIAQSMSAEFHRSGVHVGIIYLPYTENDDDKTVLTAGGETKNYHRNYKISQADAARRITSLVAKRKSRVILTFMGRFAWWIQGCFPSVADWILRVTGGNIHKISDPRR